MRDVQYTKAATKGLKRMPKHLKGKMFDAIAAIAKGDETGLNITKLQGQDGYRLRIGDYRASYTADMKVLKVVKIGPRGDFYKG